MDFVVRWSLDLDCVFFGPWGLPSRLTVMFESPVTSPTAGHRLISFQTRIGADGCSHFMRVSGTRKGRRVLVMVAAFVGWMFDGLKKGIFPFLAPSDCWKILPVSFVVDDALEGLTA